MKVIIKDINNPETNITSENIHNIKISALISILAILIPFLDLAFGGFLLDIFLDTNETVFFANSFISVSILILVFILCITYIARYMFIELKKNFSFVNPNILVILIEIFLVINIIMILISGNSIDLFSIILDLFIIVLISISVYKDIKKEKNS